MRERKHVTKRERELGILERNADDASIKLLVVLTNIVDSVRRSARAENRFFTESESHVFMAIKAVREAACLANMLSGHMVKEPASTRKAASYYLWRQREGTRA